MMEEKQIEGRSVKSAKNATISLVYYFITNIFAFVMKTFLIKYIGIEYAGLNSLVTNIIGVLNIAELGLSTAVGYSLYKPLSESNYKKINEILCLYKYLYRIIAVVVLTIGIIVTIFISSFVNTKIPLVEVRISFLLYLIATVASYLLTFLNILPSADQKNFVVVTIQNNGKIIKNILQLLSIIIFKNFYIWLIIEIVASVIIYVITNIKIQKMYKDYKSQKELSFKELLKKNKDVVKRTKDLLFHKIGGVLVYQTDNILISYFCTLTDVGIYSNYIVIYGLITGCVEQAFLGITASIGNLIIKKSEKEVYFVWKEIYSIMMFLTILCGFLFYELANPFVSVWIGEDYLLSSYIVLGISLNTMFRIIKNPIDKFKEAYGIFWDVYSPIIEVLINLIFSIILGIKFGIIGVVLGTVISNVVITMLWKPYVIFKNIFKEKFKSFILINLKYISIGSVAVIISYFIISFIKINITNVIINLVCKFVIFGMVGLIVFLMCFLMDEFFRKTLKKYIGIMFKMRKGR